MDTGYDRGMNREEFTVEDIQYILGLSYPTALKMASKNGISRDRKWFVPAEVVQKWVDREIAEVQRKQFRLEFLRRGER